MISGVFMPIFSCLGTFWFGDQSSRRTAHRVRANRERVLGALAFTFAYLAMVTGFLLFQVFLVDASQPEFSAPSLPRGLSFLDRVTASVKWAALISPFGTAPVIWLTGIPLVAQMEKMNDRRKDKPGVNPPEGAK